MSILSDKTERIPQQSILLLDNVLLGEEYHVSYGLVSHVSLPALTSSTTFFTFRTI